MRVLAPAVLALALVEAWAVGYLLLSAHRTEERLRLDPFELDHYRPARPPRPLVPGTLRVVLFGDSRIRSWPTPPSLAGFDFENRGIGNQTTAQLVGRFELDVAALRPAVAVLQLGVNDLKARSDDAEQARSDRARCRFNIAELVRRCERARIHVVLMTVFSVGAIPWYRRWSVAPDMRQAIESVNRFIRSLASPTVSVFESGAVLDDRDGSLRADYQSDYLHLNEAGYRALNTALRQTLTTLRQRLRNVP